MLGALPRADGATETVASAFELHREAARDVAHHDCLGSVHLFDHSDSGAQLDDVWRMPIINSQASEALGYATQKPVALLERIVRAYSRPGDLVADFFCGSGTTLAVAEAEGRRWIGCDIGDAAIRTTRDRLLAMPGACVFDVLEPVVESDAAAPA